MTYKRASNISRISIQVVFAIMAILIGLYPLFYFVQEKFGMLGSKSVVHSANTLWRSAFYVHIIAGGLALLVGWVQFSPKLRRSVPAIHRNIGKLYIVSALLSSICAGYLAFYAEGGFSATLGFFCLALVWCFTSYQDIPVF